MKNCVKAHISVHMMGKWFALLCNNVMLICSDVYLCCHFKPGRFCGMTFWDISVMYNELFFLLALWVHSVTVLNRVSELNKVSKMRDINCEQGLSPTLLKQFHHPPENPTSVFLRAGRLYPPSISTLPRLSVSLLFLFPSCSSSSSVFVSPSISPPPLTSGICALDTDGDYRKPGEAENLKMDFCFT